MLLFIYDTAGTDFLSKELLVEIIFLPQISMLKKAGSLKNWGVWIFCFIVLGFLMGRILGFRWVFFNLEENFPTGSLCGKIHLSTSSNL